MIKFGKDKLEVKLLQTQLVTGNGKARVYYCDIKKDLSDYFPRIFHEEYGFILKTPLKQNEIDSIILSSEIKNMLGMISDNPIQINPTSILSVNFVPVDEDDYVVKTSKLETDVKIYNGNKYSYHSDMISKNPLEVFKGLLFRKIIGTNDTVDRNFIYIANRIISIDDPALFKETEYIFKKPLAQKYRQNYIKYFDKCWSEIEQVIVKFPYIWNCIK